MKGTKIAKAWIKPSQICSQIDISSINYKAMDDLPSPMLSIQEKVPSPTLNAGCTAIASRELSALLIFRSRLTKTISSTPTTVYFESRLDQWYSYSHSLSEIKHHYTIALERSHLEAVHFTWKDSFKPSKKYSHTSIDSEKVAVVFNIGAVYSQMAAAENRGTVDGLTKAFKAFQSAAGAFRYLRETYEEGESVDVSRECVSMLETLMIAQAQECFFNRAVRAGKSATNCSKVHVAASATLSKKLLQGCKVELYYQEVLDALSSAPLNKHFDKRWFAHVQLKTAQFYAEACYHYSLHLHENDEFGEEIARLQMGMGHLRCTKRDVKGASSSLIDVISKLKKNMNSRIEKAKKENNIYQMRVPSVVSLNDLLVYVSERPRPLKTLAALDNNNIGCRT